MMANPPLAPAQRQLRRARRRLFLQLLLDALVIGWSLALIVSACWLVAQPHLFGQASRLLNWSIAGATVALATIAALVVAAIRRPSPITAALIFDERFGLKERMTTSLTLAAKDAASPAALALHDDVNSRVARLTVAERFPVRLRRSAWLLPLSGVLLVLVALLYRPAVSTATAKANERLSAESAVREEIDRKMEDLQKKAQAKRPDNKDRSAELERLDAELERIAREPRTTKDEARDIVKDLTGIEEQIKKREHELAQRADALKEQMKQVSRLSKKTRNDGLAKELQQALDQGDLKKAKEALDRVSEQLKAEQEADRLRKKLADKDLSKEERAKTEERLKKAESQQLSKEDRDQLRNQMQGIKDKLERLSRNKEQKEQDLRDQAKKGEIDKDQLDRELQQLERDTGPLSDKDLEDLKRMAEKLANAQQSLQEGDDAGAAKLLDELGDEMAALDREGEMQELAEKLKDCEECKGAMCQALDGKPVPAAGRRPESKQTVTNSVEQRERAKMGKGQLSVIDTKPGDGFKGPRKPAELTEEIRRASQEAPEAIDRQRLPRSASDMARGYFDKLRGDRESKKSP